MTPFVTAIGMLLFLAVTFAAVLAIYIAYQKRSQKEAFLDDDEVVSEKPPSPIKIGGDLVEYPFAGRRETGQVVEGRGKTVFIERLSSKGRPYRVRRKLSRVMSMA